MSNYYKINSQQLGEGARIPLLKLGDSGEVFYEMALEMFETMEDAIRTRGKAVLIVPVGPVGQYHLLAKLINRKKLDLKKIWFINMDEYLDDKTQYISIENPLSFRAYMEKNFHALIEPHLAMPEAHRVFPDPNKPEAIADLIENLGGVDACFGGLGINGHVAFNEPENISPEAFLQLSTRVISMAPETWAINAAGSLGGALESMPKFAVTIGFKEIYGARKIRLYVFRDWHRAVIRRAAYGEISTAFPVTLLQKHPNCRITCNQIAAASAY